ncbi:MAG: glycosyltransferase [Niabella sp.]
MPFSVVTILLYVFAFVSSALVFYYLYFFARLAFYKPQNSVSADQSSLSIIVCARNEEKNLEENVPVLLEQEYEAPHELLVVNDNSEDNTKMIMQWMAREKEGLKLINMEREAQLNIGKKYPLSIGIRESKYNHLLLTDADCVPSSNQWAAKMQSAFKPGIEIVLGYGPYEKQEGWLNRIIRFETFHTALQYLSYALAGLAYMGVGRNLSYTKELFSKHKGFASINHLPGGDDDLFIKKAATATNTAIMIDAEAHTISQPKKTWSDWRRQKTRHYSTSKYYKPQHKFLLGLYSLSQFLFYPLLVAAFVFNWQLALILFIVKSAIQYVVFSNAMKKLNEADLTKWIFVMDFWMFFYYLFFANTLWKKEKKTW